jgi:hypothetical protein
MLMLSVISDLRSPYVRTIKRSIAAPILLQAGRFDKTAAIRRNAERFHCPRTSACSVHHKEPAAIVDAKRPASHSAGEWNGNHNDRAFQMVGVPA